MADSSGLYEYVTDSGVIIPDTSTIKESVEESYRTVFGDGVDLTDESVGGRLVERDTAALAQTIGVIAQNANQFNPHFSTGVYLDHLANMFGFSRNQATYTRVYATVGGDVGTVIPKGSLAKTESGDTFESEENIEISDATGFAYGWFKAVSAGAVPCGAGDLDSIQTSVAGWNSITNENTALSSVNPTVIGIDTETDAHLRDRLLTSVWSGVGFAKSIEARVADVDGVKSCVVLENNGPQPKVVRCVNIPPHSICVCVDGGDNTEVAKAIYASRSAGCGYTTSIETNSTTGPTLVSVNLPDEDNGVVHTVYFVTPATQSISVALTAKADGFAGSGTQTLQTAVKSAIDDYLANMKMGVEVSEYKLAQAISEAIPSISISSISVTGFTTGQIPAYQKYDCEGGVTIVTLAS